MMPTTKNMELLKLWGSLLANCGTSVCVIPTTYFMQDVQVLAYANEATETESDASSSNPNCTPNQSNCELSSDCNAYDYSQEETTHNDLNEELPPIIETKKSAKKRTSIQRIRHSREEYRCPTCTYTCTTEKAFVRHLRDENCETEDSGNGCVSNEKMLSCPICGKDRDGESLLLSHMKKHRDDKYFCCDLCKFRSLQLKKLIQHRRMHTGEKPHLCPFCKYRSARRDNLRSHARRVHKKDNLICDTFAPRNMILTPGKYEESQ